MKDALAVARLHLAWARARGMRTCDVVQMFTGRPVHRLVTTDRAIEILAHEWLRACDRLAIRALSDAA
jgi:hypothetical protein